MSHNTDWDQVYIARDQDGTLTLFGHEPENKSGEFAYDYDDLDKEDYVFLESDMFPEVTCQNSPQDFKKFLDKYYQKRPASDIQFLLNNE